MATNPTPNRAYGAPTVNASTDVWGQELNDMIGEGDAIPATPPTAATSAVPVPVSAPNGVDFDVQDALNRGQQALIDADAAQTVADAALPLAGASTPTGDEGQLTGRVDSKTGTFRMVTPGASAAGTLTLDASDADAFVFTLTENITTLIISNLADRSDQTQAIMLFVTAAGFTIDFDTLGTVKYTGGSQPDLSTNEDVIVLVTQDVGVNWRFLFLQKNLF